MLLEAWTIINFYDWRRSVYLSTSRRSEELMLEAMNDSGQDYATVANKALNERRPIDPTRRQACCAYSNGAPTTWICSC